MAKAKKETLEMTNVQINGVLTQNEGTTGGPGKTTTMDLTLVTMLDRGIVPDYLVEIENHSRWAARLAKSVGGADLAKAIEVFAPEPDRDVAKDNPKAFVQHFNPLWGRIRKARVSLMDQGANVFRNYAKFWTDETVNMRDRCAKAGILVQSNVICIPEAEAINAAVAAVKVTTEKMLPGDGLGKLFITFNEKDQPKGFGKLEGYQEYRYLRDLCDKGVATPIFLPACTSDFFRWARNEDISVLGLMEHLADHDAHDPKARARFEALCRKVGIDPEDEITVDQELDGVYEWLGTAKKEFGKLIHPAMSVPAAQAAE